MCLILETDADKRIKIAENDIKVYKLCTTTKRGNVYSYYHHTKRWTIGKQEKRVLRTEKSNITGHELTKTGLYSYHENKKIRKFIGYTVVDGSAYCNSNLVKLNCIIPKGSRYYCVNGVYVSDNIIPTDVEQI